MTFLAFRLFRHRKHRNDVIMTSYIKISQILKLKSKDITSKTLHAKFYASRRKTSELAGGKIRPLPRVWSVFKSPGKLGLRYHKIGLIPGNHQAVQMVKIPVPGSKEKSVHFILAQSETSIEIGLLSF